MDHTAPDIDVATPGERVGLALSPADARFFDQVVEHIYSMDRRTLMAFSVKDALYHLW